MNISFEIREDFFYITTDCPQQERRDAIARRLRSLYVKQYNQPLLFSLSEASFEEETLWRALASVVDYDLSTNKSVMLPYVMVSLSVQAMTTKELIGIETLLPECIEGAYHLTYLPERSDLIRFIEPDESHESPTSVLRFHTLID